MGKKSRRKRERREAKRPPNTAAPSPEVLEEVSEAIRQSSIWDGLVQILGEKKAEELLEDCKDELR